MVSMEDATNVTPYTVGDTGDRLSVAVDPCTSPAQSALLGLIFDVEKTVSVTGVPFLTKLFSTRFFRWRGINFIDDIAGSDGLDDRELQSI